MGVVGRRTARQRPFRQVILKVQLWTSSGGRMSTAEQRAWEREQKRRLEQAGEDEAARLNDELYR
jgi:hypothetical protein